MYGKYRKAKQIYSRLSPCLIITGRRKTISRIVDTCNNSFIKQISIYTAILDLVQNIGICDLSRTNCFTNINKNMRYCSVKDTLEITLSQD